MIPLLAPDAIGTLEDGLRITYTDTRMLQSAKQMENNESRVGRRLPRAVVARRLAKAPISVECLCDHAFVNKLSSPYPQATVFLRAQRIQPATWWINLPPVSVKRRFLPA
jgi:hypothetical protein